MIIDNDNDNWELNIHNGNFAIMNNLTFLPAVEAEPQKSSRFSSFGREVSSALIVANDDNDVFLAQNAVWIFSWQKAACLERGVTP